MLVNSFMYKIIYRPTNLYITHLYICINHYLTVHQRSIIIEFSRKSIQKKNTYKSNRIHQGIKITRFIKVFLDQVLNILNSFSYLQKHFTLPHFASKTVLNETVIRVIQLLVIVIVNIHLLTGIWKQQHQSQHSKQRHRCAVTPLVEALMTNVTSLENYNKIGGGNHDYRDVIKNIGHHRH